jgi:uncharacterized protein (DUF1697 family)
VKYVALLRGVNVGVKNRVKMESLKNCFELLQFKDIKTYLQSGNIVFEYSQEEPKILEALIEKALSQSLEIETKVLIKTVEEMASIEETYPFEEKLQLSKSQIYVTFLSDLPDQNYVLAMNSSVYIDPETCLDCYRIVGKIIYVYCERGYSKTIFNNAFFEKKLKILSTTRNWKTTTQLIDMIKL